ncbi:MAG: hypothetical protein ACRDZ4_07220 [Egibacteraceae bacterium]
MQLLTRQRELFRLLLAERDPPDDGVETMAAIALGAHSSRMGFR